MGEKILSRLRFNLGFLLEATFGESRTIELDYPDIRISADLTLSPLQGTIKATRTSEGIFIGGTLNSRLEQECVRCLQTYQHPVVVQLDELFNYPPATAPDGEYVVGENGFIDLAPLVRELALLEIPMQPLCQENCQGLCQECGTNLNESDCGCEQDDIDPRLAALKQLLDK